MHQTKIHQPRSVSTNLHQVPHINGGYLTMLLIVIFMFKLLNITPSSVIFFSEK